MNKKKAEPLFIYCHTYLHCTLISTLDDGILAVPGWKVGSILVDSVLLADNTVTQQSVQPP